MLRASLAEMVSRLRDRLTEEPDGKAKRLRESTVQKLRDFLSSFDFRNVTNDRELKEQVEKARALLGGISTDAIRNTNTLRARIREGMAEIATQMDALVVDRPTGSSVSRMPRRRCRGRGRGFGGAVPGCQARRCDVHNLPETHRQKYL